MQLIYCLNIRGFYRKYIRGFSIRTGTLLTVIIILYIVTLPPQDFLAKNEHEKLRSLKETIITHLQNKLSWARNVYVEAHLVQRLPRGRP